MSEPELKQTPVALDLGAVRALAASAPPTPRVVTKKGLSVDGQDEPEEDEQEAGE